MLGSLSYPFLIVMELLPHFGFRTIVANSSPLWSPLLSARCGHISCCSADIADIICGPAIGAKS